MHAGFQIRFRQTDGDGSDWDYWHADDVCLTPGSQVTFSLEEDGWTGAPGEVLDSGPDALNGTVFGGADNDQTSPAIAGNSCSGRSTSERAKCRNWKAQCVKGWFELGN